MRHSFLSRLFTSDVPDTKQLEDQNKQKQVFIHFVDQVNMHPSQAYSVYGTKSIHDDLGLLAFFQLLETYDYNLSRDTFTSIIHSYSFIEGSTKLSLFAKDCTAWTSQLEHDIEAYMESMYSTIAYNNRVYGSEEATKRYNEAFQGWLVPKLVEEWNALEYVSMDVSILYKEEASTWKIMEIKREGTSC